MEQCDLFCGCRGMRGHQEYGDTASVFHGGQLAGGRDELSNGLSFTKCSSQVRAHMATRNALSMFYSYTCTYFLKHT